MRLPGIETRRWRVVIPVLAALALAAACVAPAAAFASGWSIEGAAGPPGPPSGGLSDVSCPSVGTCFAVGSYTDPSWTQWPLAEVRNGDVWATQGTPSLAAGGALDGVSCTSATAC